MRRFSGLRSRWAIALGLLLGAFLPSLALSTHPGAGLPLMLAVVVIAVAAIAFALIGFGTAATFVVALAAEREAEQRSAARQCDPDAPGHVRSRAPGRLRAVYC